MQRVFRVSCCVSCRKQINERYQDRQSYLPVAVPVAVGRIGQLKGSRQNHSHARLVIRHWDRFHVSGPFEILSRPLAFGQFFDCRRQNSEPIKIPNPFLFVWNLVSGNRREARSGQPCRLLNHQGGDCRQAVTLAPARDQIQGPSQWIWTATVYSVSKILISDRLAVSGASHQDQVCP